MRSILAMVAMLGLALPIHGQEAQRPIIDIHLHAYPALQPTAEDSIWIPLHVPLPATDTLVMDQTIAKMEQHNIVLGVLSGSRAAVAAWADRAPDPCISLMPRQTPLQGIGSGFAASPCVIRLFFPL